MVIIEPPGQYIKKRYPRLYNRVAKSVIETDHGFWQLSNVSQVSSSIVESGTQVWKGLSAL